MDRDTSPSRQAADGGEGQPQTSATQPRAGQQLVQERNGVLEQQALPQERYRARQSRAALPNAIKESVNLAARNRGCVCVVVETPCGSRVKDKSHELPRAITLEFGLPQSRSSAGREASWI